MAIVVGRGGARGARGACGSFVFILSRNFAGSLASGHKNLRLYYPSVHA